jgi:hypothetical protein
MRILNRPMFRYGGPIKEGVMHGMRDGGRAALVGNPVYPRTGGREHHKLNYLNPMYWKNIMTGAQVAKNPTIGSKIYQGVKKWMTPKTMPSTVRHGLGRTRVPTKMETIKNWYKTTPVGKYIASTPEGKGITYGLTAGKGIVPKVIKGATKSPLLTGGVIWGTDALPGGQPLLNLDMLGNRNILGQRYDPKTDKRIKGTGISSLWEDEEKIKTPPSEKIIKEKWDPGAGGEDYVDPNVAKKLAQQKQNERLKSYLEMMGYDSAKKGALSDALIDASALVQDASTEAGSLKHADWGKLINRMIQTTGKRLDKPEQIREAVGLMATKAAIQKDMTAEEDALNKLYKEMQIKIGKKTLAGTTFEEIISDRMIKGDMLKGNDLASLLRIKKGIDAKVISTKAMKADEDALTYVTKIISDKKKEGTPYPPGHYIISDRIVVVDEQGNANKVL